MELDRHDTRPPFGIPAAPALHFCRTVPGEADTVTVAWRNDPRTYQAAARVSASG